MAQETPDQKKGRLYRERQKRRFKFLDKRIGELHKDPEGRYPGRLAREQADKEYYEHERAGTLPE
jgi:hypothetical protein